MSTVEELLYDLALHSLEQQERQVAELRARTGTLLAAAALSATFFGGAAAGVSGPTPLVVPALGTAVVALGFCLSVLAPHPMAFIPDVPTLHEQLVPERDMRAVWLRMAYALDRQRAKNDPIAERLAGRFRAASGWLGAEVVLWLAALAVP